MKRLLVFLASFVLVNIVFGSASAFANDANSSEVEVGDTYNVSECPGNSGEIRGARYCFLDDEFGTVIWTQNGIVATIETREVLTDRQGEVVTDTEGNVQTELLSPEEFKQSNSVRAGTVTPSAAAPISVSSNETTEELAEIANQAGELIGRVPGAVDTATNDGLVGTLGRDLFIQYLTRLTEQPSIVSSSNVANESWLSLIAEIRVLFYWLSAFMVVGGIIWAGVRMTWNKSGMPLADVFKASATFVFVASLATTFIASMALASDSLTKEILEWGDFEEQRDTIVAPIDFDAIDIGGAKGLFLDILQEIPGGNILDFSGNTIYQGIFLVAVSILVIMLIMKEVSIIVAMGVLPFAASGQFFQFSKPWLDKILGTLIALLLYKPFVAIILRIGFEMMKEGTAMMELAGIACIFMGALSINPLMKIFNSFQYSGGIGSGSSMGSGAAMRGASAGQQGAPSGAAEPATIR